METHGRNVLLARTRLLPPRVGTDPEGGDARVLYGEGLFAIAEVTDALGRLGLPPETPLTVLAAEVFEDPPEEDPLGVRLGHARILRISPLAVGAGCVLRSDDPSGTTSPRVIPGTDGSTLAGRAAAGAQHQIDGVDRP